MSGKKQSKKKILDRADKPEDLNSFEAMDSKRIIGELRSEGKATSTVFENRFISRQALIFKLLSSGEIKPSDIPEIKNRSTLLDRHQVISIICNMAGMDQDDITRSPTDGDARDVRNMIYYILRFVLGLPLNEIGRTFYGKDHKSVQSALDSFEEKMLEHPFGVKVKSICNMIDREGMQKCLDKKATATSVTETNGLKP